MAKTKIQQEPGNKKVDAVKEQSDSKKKQSSDSKRSNNVKTADKKADFENPKDDPA
ncbi:hypothetical protein [Pedobacter jamesrossensis]|uniref:Uncharacterized protein n=1 Tax=Pedobacter jamesrossensis TaxID=1908238 RepID=A0ABV8NKN8_9SPHI